MWALSWPAGLFRVHHRCKVALQIRIHRQSARNEARNGKQGRLADFITRLVFVIMDELGYLPWWCPSSARSVGIQRVRLCRLAHAIENREGCGLTNVLREFFKIVAARAPGSACSRAAAAKQRLSMDRRSRSILSCLTQSVSMSERRCWWAAGRDNCMVEATSGRAERVESLFPIIWSV